MRVYTPKFNNTKRGKLHKQFSILQIFWIKKLKDFFGFKNTRSKSFQSVYSVADLLLCEQAITLKKKEFLRKKNIRKRYGARFSMFVRSAKRKGKRHAVSLLSQWRRQTRGMVWQKGLYRLSRKMVPGHKKRGVGQKKKSLSRAFWIFLTRGARPLFISRKVVGVVSVLLIIGVVFQTFSFRSVSGATYTWNQTDWSGGVSALHPAHTGNQTGWTKYESATGVSSVTAGSVSSSMETGSFTESFDNATYRDGATTTATWSGGQVVLPAQSSENIFGSLSGAWTASDTILSSIYVPSTNEVYLGMTGQLWKYNAQTGVAVNVTPAVTAYLGANAIMTLAFDSVGNKVYLGGDNGKFIQYDPVSGTAVNLTSGTWGTYKINASALDVSNRFLYLIGNASRFARYNITTGVITDFTAVISPSLTAGANINALAFDSSRNDVYFGGSGGKFGVFHATNGTGENLVPALPASWGTALVYAITFDSIHNKIYVGGISRQFAVYDPAVGTSVYLSPNILTIWGTAAVYTLAFDAVSGKVYMGGSTGKFGMYDPATTVATNFSSTISSFWSTNDVKTLAINPVLARTYMAGAVGNFAVFSDPPTAVAQSIAVDTLAGNVQSVTLSKNDTPGTGSVAYAVSNDGGSNFFAVTPGTPYTFSAVGNSDLRFKITLAGNATVQDVTLAYDGYVASGSIISSAFNSESAQNVLADVQWSESLVAGTDIVVQIRTAPDSAGSPGTWGIWMGPDGTNATYFTDPTGVGENIPAVLRDGNSDQWIQYKAFFTSNGKVTATLSDVTMTYIVNDAPVVGSVSAVQGSDGKITISYEVKDPDSLSGNITPGFITPSFQYWNGSAWATIPSLAGGDTNNKAVQEGSFTAYTAVWDVATDISNTYSAGVYAVRVTANDNEGANNFGSADSSVFTVDTLAPTSLSVRVNAGVVPAVLTIGATDNAVMQMKVSLNSDMSGAVWESYATSRTIDLVADPATVYVQFKDAYNNISSIISVTTPETPTSVIAQDVSNLTWVPQEYRMFLAWKTVADPTPGFDHYTVYRSLSANNNFASIATINNRATNYYSDSTISFDTIYYFKMTTTDTQGNVSFPSTAVFGKANGTQDSGEGGGGVESTPPIISNVSVAHIDTTQATITWDTDEIASSTVGYSTGPGVFANETGNALYVDHTGSVGQHSVTVTGLSPNTLYYFRVRSGDPVGNTASDDNGGQGFTFVTLPGPVISGVALSSSSNEQAVITWNTTVPATTKVLYSTSTANGSLVSPVEVGSGALALQHTQAVSGLSGGTRYLFSVQSVDGSGNTATDNNGGNFYAFTTTSDAVPPVLSGIDASFVTIDKAVILWSSNEQATGQVQYAETAGGPYTETIASSTYDHGHYVIVPNLTADTTYFYRAVSTDLSGNRTVSDEAQFTTQQDIAFQHNPLSSISNISDPPQVVTDTKAVITFRTDQLALCAVEYGTASGNYTEIPVAEISYNNDHAIHLPGLIFSTTYYYKITCQDNLATVVVSPEKMFVTLARQVDSGSEAGDSTAPILSAVTVTSVSARSATITWTTDENTNDLVRYATEAEVLAGATQMVGGDAALLSDKASFSTAHSVALSNLIPGTAYAFSAISYDASGNIGESAQGTFDTSAVSGPSIANTASSVLSNSSVIISWETAVPATTLVSYSTTILNGALVAPVNEVEMTPVTEHAYTMSGLSPGTQYFFRVQSEDESGNTETDDNGGSFYTFTMTSDSTPPVLSGIDASFVTADRVMVVWLSDEPTTGRMRYGEVSGGPFTETAISSSYDWAHSVMVSGLRPDTQYFYQVVSVDANGNVAVSAEQNFTTRTNASYDHDPLSSIASLSDPPYVLTDTKAVITFKTDQLAMCFVEYGTESDQYGAIPVSETAENTEHSLTIAELTFSTAYFYAIQCEDNLNTIISSEQQTFTTLARQVSSGSELSETVAPIVSGVGVADILGESAVVTWKTDENTNGLVRYGTEADLQTSGTMMISGDGLAITKKESFSLDHIITLSNLVPGTKYYYSAISYDTSGNIGESAQGTFTTKSPSTISSINILSQKVGDVTLTWKTAQDMSSIVEYGLTEVYGDKTESGTMTKEHSLTLTNLDNNQIYHFRIKGSDANKNLYASSDYTFEPKSLPTVSNVTVKVISDNEAEVSFVTSVPTDSLVTYASIEGSKNSGSQGKPEFVQTHTITLKNLESGVSYEGKIQVRDEAGNEVAEVLKSFTTSQDDTPPEIDRIKTDMALAQDGKVQAIISWMTNELSTTAVVYKEGLSGEEKTVGEKSDLAVAHIVVLTTFKTGSVYYVKTKSVDKSGNESVSQERMVLTPQITANIVEVIVGNFKDIFSWAKVK